jgi:hypothetical protein
MMIGAYPTDSRFAKYPAAKPNVVTRKMMPQKIARLFFMHQSYQRAIKKFSRKHEGNMRGRHALKRYHGSA